MAWEGFSSTGWYRFATLGHDVDSYRIKTHSGAENCRAEEDAVRSSPVRFRHDLAHGHGCLCLDNGIG